MWRLKLTLHMAVSLELAVAQVIAVRDVSAVDVVADTVDVVADTVDKVGAVAPHHLVPLRLSSCDQITPVDTPVPATVPLPITLSTHNNTFHPETAYIYCS